MKTHSGESIDLYKNSYALLIGVSDYTAGWDDLLQIDYELDDVEAVLKEHGFHITRVRNPDHQELEDAFEQFIYRYGYDRDNRLLVFFSGHGYTRANGSKGYLVPSDAPNPLVDIRGFLHKSLGMNQILTWARDIEAKHALFLFDSCFSGTVFKAKSLPIAPPHITALTARDVRQFITAGNAGEEVPAKSTFTPAFVDALKHKKGDLNKDGYVTGTELGLYLRAELPKYIGQTPQFGRIQDYELSQGDFIFLLPSFVVTPPPPPTTIPAMQFGYLQINVNVPNTKVAVNGRSMGSASPGQPLNLTSGFPEGTVRVVVSAKGYKTESLSAAIKPNVWTTATFALIPLAPPKARLIVRSNVSGDTWLLNNKAMGSTGSKAHDIAPGRYEVKVMINGYLPFTKTVDIAADAEETVLAKLSPEPKLSTVHQVRKSKTKYLASKLTIAMRSGQSTNHKILSLIPSRTPVEMLQTNKDSGYSLIRLLTNGNERWVLTRQLTRQDNRCIKQKELSGNIWFIENKLKSL